jgi:Flp pilus assembly protein TadD
LPATASDGTNSAVEPLAFADLHRARAAEGWLELGDPVEAARELQELSEPARRHPDVLEICWRLHATRKDWEAALAVARILTRTAPEQVTGWIHQSYCLHELKQTEEAWRVLLPQAARFPQDSTIAYNLACYACQMGDLGAARQWLATAARQRSRKEIRALGIQDPDLAPLREFLAGW